MKDLLPKSLMGQTMLVLLVGLTLSHIISLMIYTNNQTEVLIRMSGHHVAQRVASVVHLLVKTPKAERHRVFSALNEPSFRLFIASGNLHNHSDDRHWLSREIKRILQQKLIADEVGEIRVKTEHFKPNPNNPSEDQATRIMQETTPHIIFRIVIELGNGQRLHFISSIPEPAPFWSSGAVYSLLLTGLVIALLSIWVVQRLTTPLREFAEAADRLGKNMQAPALPEKGTIELHRAARAFNKMQQRLQRFIEGRTRMLAAISHDLRTPITLLRLRTEVVEDEEEKQKMLSTLNDMETMIASTMTLAREELRTEDIKNVDLSALLESLCLDMEDRSYAVVRNLPEKILYPCRSTAMKRALSNVLENALKYGNEVGIEMRCLSEKIEIQINDAGPGIPEEKLEEVFSPFYRLEPSRNSETGGIGLGLSITQAIIHAHGGEITLSNRPKHGLQVNIRLPL